MDEKDRKIAELERKVEAMRTGQDIEFQETLRRRTFQDLISAGTVDTATTGNILQAVNEGGSATYNVADEFDFRLRVEVDGTDYYVGLYSV